MNFKQMGTVALGVAMMMGSGAAMSASAQTTAKQDIKNAGHETKDAAVDTGHATKKATKKAAHKTKRAAVKTKNATENLGDRIVNKPEEHPK